MTPNAPDRLRVCAVSFLNTVPLVWGMLHGPQKGRFDLEFRLPSGCADALASGEADIGLVPAFELTRQDLEILPGTCIGSRGPVRSILLISSRPADQIRTVAADTSSRTSVQLARVVLTRKFGVSPSLIPHPPELDAMLRVADAALVIGDPALRIDPGRLPYHVYDLGAAWTEMTGLPMVFAVWAGRRGVVGAEVAAVFQQSLHYGQSRMDEIVGLEAARREFSPALVREYLTQHIVHELGEREREGMERFLAYATELAPATANGGLTRLP